MIMTKFSDANIIVVSNKKTKIESLDRAKKIFAQAKYSFFKNIRAPSPVTTEFSPVI